MVPFNAVLRKKRGEREPHDPCEQQLPGKVCAEFNAQGALEAGLSRG